MSVPKIIHQIWVGPEPIPERECGFRHKLIEMHQDYDHYIWRDGHIPTLHMPESMQKVYDLHYASGKYAMAADVLRLFVVYKFGGFYVDIDEEPLQPLDHFLQFDGVFCYHPSQKDDFTIPNGFFGAEKEHPIMKHLTDAIEFGWWIGPSFFGEEVRKFFNLPNEIDQAVIKQRLFGFGIEYFDWQEFDQKYMKNHALYSWK